MKFTLTVQSKGAALTDPDAGTWELADIVAKVADMVREGHTSGPLYESNGNACGSWEYTK